MNVNGGWARKAPTVMEDARKRGIDFLGLQETDKAAVIQQTAKPYGYRAFSKSVHVTTLVDREWEQ